MNASNDASGAADSWSIHRRQRVGSTMEEILTVLRPEAYDRVALVADRQLIGRGRRGHAWESPLGGLWLSFTVAIDTVDPFVGILAAAAARNVAELFTPAASGYAAATRLSLKWPNDLRVGGKKWGGIVAEQKSPFPTPGPFPTPPTPGSVIIVGVGLNLDFTFAPDERPPLATTLSEAFGQSPSPDEMLAPLLTEFDRLLAVDRHDRGRSLEEITPHVSTLGQQIRWQEGTQHGHGRAISLDRSGALRVRDASGTERLLHAAEVHHVGPGSQR